MAQIASSNEVIFPMPSQFVIPIHGLGLRQTGDSLVDRQSIRPLQKDGLRNPTLTPHRADIIYREVLWTAVRGTARHRCNNEDKNPIGHCIARESHSFASPVRPSLIGKPDMDYLSTTPSMSTSPLKSRRCVKISPRNPLSSFS